ncbi:hypothetical protein [uncultured Bosea sp.]|uniref:hypothetical protein n=1 Tax=uncultured Bosea sp. TaxID=211457 RepID=UPI00262F1B76|nr:hypothetical protein [uncultured Bosea sp.]
MEQDPQQIAALVEDSRRQGILQHEMMERGQRRPQHDRPPVAEAGEEREDREIVHMHVGLPGVPGKAEHQRGNLPDQHGDDGELRDQRRTGHAIEKQEDGDGGGDERHGQQGRMPAHPEAEGQQRYMQQGETDQGERHAAANDLQGPVHRGSSPCAAAPSRQPARPASVKDSHAPRGSEADSGRGATTTIDGSRPLLSTRSPAAKLRATASAPLIQNGNTIATGSPPSLPCGRLASAAAPTSSVSRTTSIAAAAAPVRGVAAEGSTQGSSDSKRFVRKGMQDYERYSRKISLNPASLA